MSIIAETLRSWAAAAEKATQMPEATFDSHVSVRRFATMDNRVTALELHVMDRLKDLERMIQVIDERQEAMMPQATLQIIPPAPKAKRAARKSKAKAKTTATKRKRRTKAQMKQDAANS